MPRKKKKGSASRKPSLEFCEPPLDGSRHVYESPLLPALNPRSVNVFFPHDTGVPWVSPQFDSAVQMKYRLRHRHGQRNVSMLYGRDQSNSSYQNLLPLKRRIPTLTFKESTKFSCIRSTAAPLGCLHSSKGDLQTRSSTECFPMSLNRCTLDKLTIPGFEKQTASYNSPVNFCNDQGCSSPRMNEIVKSLDSAFTPPGVDTPEMNVRVLSRDRRDKAVEKFDAAGACQKSPLDILFQDFCLPSCTPEGVPVPVVLVCDTPEHEYGLRMSWRRKQNCTNCLENLHHHSNPDMPVTN